MRHTFLILLSILTVSLKAQSVRDTLAVKREAIYLKNKIIENPVWILDDQTRGNVFMNYSSSFGGFRNYDHPTKNNQITFHAEGFGSTKKMSFFGKIRYQKAKEFNLNWNTTSFISKENPFIVSDSIGGTYDNEIYALNGKIAGSVIKKWLKWGVAFDYKVGDKVDQTDPRPKIRSQRMKASPGISFLPIKNLAIGVNSYYEKLIESIHFNIVDTHSDYSYLRHKGFGTYSSTIDDYFSRDYNGYRKGLTFFKKYTYRFIQNTFEIKYQKTYERAQEGSKLVAFLAGDYISSSTTYSNYLSIDKASKKHHLDVQITNQEIKGIWFNQTQITEEGDNIRWKVFAKSIQYVNEIMNYNFLYTYQTHKDIIALGAELTSESAKLYPEEFQLRYSNIVPKFTFSHLWNLKKIGIKWSSKFSYRYILDKYFFIEKIDLKDIITTSNYQYKTINLLGNTNSFKISFKKLLKDESITPYLSLKWRFVYATDEQIPLYHQKTRMLISAKIGVNFN